MAMHRVAPVTDDVAAHLDAARDGDEAAFARLIQPYRRELRAHCYRMAGSIHDADDLLQESLLRAWRGLASFEGRSSLRTWLYRVATHACLDKLDTRAARTLPSGNAAEAADALWLEPAPAELYERRETVAFAFLLALQLLSAKQRAVLLLRDVVGMQASEVAEQLGITVAAVNSALQRAHGVLAERPARLPPRDTACEAALTRYLAAWEGADARALVALLREEATLVMPPLPMRLVGAQAIADAIAQMVFTGGALRMIPTEANGLPAFGGYQRGADGVFAPRAIHAVEVVDGAVAAITAFLDPALFPRFGLPPAL